MLTSRDKKLLTTYVDGECSPREAQLVGRLLRRSEAARALLARLEDDSQTLRSMPALTIPIDLTDPVLAAARSRPAVPAPVVPVPRVVFPVWRGVAAAAGVLFLVGLGSFWVSREDGPAPKLANRTGKKSDAPSNEKKMAQAPKDDPGKPGPKPAPAPAPKEQKPDDPEWPSVRGPEMVDPEVDDPPEKPSTTVITSGVMDALQPLERVTLTLPSIHQAHRLDEAESANNLLDQLASSKGFRLELLCKDGTRGLERLRAAMAAKSVTVTIDPVAQARMKKPLVRSDYAVYIENIKPQELLELVRDAAVADRKAADKKPAEQRFDGGLVVKPLGPSDRKELVGLLGLDPVRSRPQPAKRPAKVDITKPISDLTGQQVGDALKGLGAPRPGAPRPALNAIVVPLSGRRVRSAELKRYLESRTPAQPDTVQALIVLRQV